MVAGTVRPRSDNTRGKNNLRGEENGDGDEEGNAKGSGKMILKTT